MIQASFKAPPQSGVPFPGQQDGERILYVVEPHWLGGVWVSLRVIAVAAAIVAVFYASLAMGAEFSVEWQVRVYLLIALCTVIGIWTMSHSAMSCRTFITDRRIVRVDSFVPLYKRRRALFWNEVVKTKSYAPNLLFRVLHVGTVSIRPNFSGDEDVLMPFTYLHDDMASYIDKITFIYRNKPGEMDAVREFVAKPRGQRYPQSAVQ